MRPVLVTARLVRNDNYPEDRECLDRRWAPLLLAADLLPVVALSGAPPGALLDAVRPAGVILTGGNDLGALGGDDLSAARDAFELALLGAARERGLPVLGVCRGAQLLAWEAGGTLARVDGHVATTHGLRVEAGAPFASLVTELGAVNSYHGFGVTALDATVIARADDGTVEAFARGRELALMWHPERFEVPRAAELALLRALFAQEDRA